MKNILLLSLFIFASCKSDPTPTETAEPTEPTESANPEPTGAFKPTPSKTPAAPENPEPAPAPNSFPTAAPVPGKPGYVLNPWTKETVDVRGIPPGALLLDPTDPNPDHKFRTP